MQSIEPERRRAGRLECRIPVLVQTAGRSLQAQTRNMSRVGTLLRIPFTELGLSQGATLSRLGREVTYLLGERVRLDLHYEILGALVRRIGRPVRVGRTSVDQDYLEVGFELQKPLSDAEVEFLGIPLPPLKDESLAAEEGILDATANGNGNGKRRTVVLCANSDEHVPPLRVVATDLNDAGARADLGPVEHLPVLLDNKGPAGILAGLAEIYGSEPLSVMFVDGEPVWSGATRLQAVEVSPRSERVGLQLEFVRRLNLPEQRRLGLA